MKTKRYTVGGFALTGKIEFLPYVKVLNTNPPINVYETQRDTLMYMRERERKRMNLHIFFVGDGEIIFVAISGICSQSFNQFLSWYAEVGCN